MVKSTIISNPVSMAVSVAKVARDSWEVKPSFMAFPAPLQPQPKNIIFLLDTSSSMGMGLSNPLILGHAKNQSKTLVFGVNYQNFSSDCLVLLE